MSEQLVQVINVILDGNSTAEQRSQCEKMLEQQREENPTLYLSTMLNCLQQHPDQGLKTFCLVQIRKNLSTFSESSYNNKWTKITEELQGNIKRFLFESLLNEQNQALRHQIADAIGEIGGSILGEETTKNQWPELVGDIFKLIQTNQVNNIESGLIIIGSMLAYCVDSFNNFRPQLLEICKMGIDHSENKIKLAAIECLGSYVESSEYKEWKPFESLIINSLQAIWNICEKDENIGSQALTVFCDLAETEPKFFRNFFKETFMTMHKICFNKTISDQGIKKMATEMMITIGERVPKLFKDNVQQLQQLIEMIFLQMVEIDDTIEESWSFPPEGYNDDIEEDSDLEMVRFGMSAVDRLISAIGQKILLPVLSQIVQQSLLHSDWRYQNAGIMSLSQVGEYLDSCTEVEPIILAVLKFANNSNPKIRYAVCHCIGQIADDMQPDFQTYFHATVMPILITLLDDPIPRVVSHAAAALTNYVEGMALEQFKPYMQTLLTKLCSLLVNDKKNISIVKENAIAAIAASSEAASVEFTAYYQEVSQFLFSMLQSHQGKEYRQLRGQLIECLTLIAHAVGWKTFKPASEQLISFMIQIQEGPLDVTDPQKSYLLSGWQRLCLVMSKDFAVYLPKIIPSLFRLIENVFNDNQNNMLNSEEDKKVTINTYDTEEAEVAINMLSVMMEELKELYIDYVEQTTKILLPLVNYSTNEDIRKSVAKCLPSLVICTKCKSNEGAVNITRAFIQVLIKAIEGEYAPDVIVDQIAAMKECIEVCGVFLSKQELTDFSQKVFVFLMESDKRKTEDEKTKQQEEMDEDDIELLNQELEVEEDLQVQIAELFGILFKTHKEQSLDIANHIYNTVLPKALDPSQTQKMHKFGIFLVDDMVEYLGYQLIGDKWLSLLEALIKYSTSKTCYVRQAAVYGIGIFAEKSVGFINESNKGCLNQMLNALKQSLEVVQGDEKAKVYGHTRDNSVAAIGRILKNHSDKIDATQVLSMWLQLLPLQYDENEGFIQHEMLADLVLINPTSILGANGENLVRIIELYALILDGKCQNDQVKAKILQSVPIIKQYPNLGACLGQLEDKLTLQQKQKLENAFKQ